MKRIAVLVEVEPGDGIGEFEPMSIVALEGEVADEIADTRDGKAFACGGVVAKGGGLEILTGELRVDLNLQGRG